MEHRDYNYYEANAASINMGDITSSAMNANTLQRLRDGDVTLSHLNLGREGLSIHFYIGQGDDLGWVGYFIGKSECLRYLGVNFSGGHAFVEGIARNQSIRKIRIYDLNNDGFTSMIRVLHSFSQLEVLTIEPSNNVDPDGWSELGTLLESGDCKLKELSLCGNNYIGNEGMGILSNGLRGIGSSLKVLDLSENSIGNEGVLAVVEALQSCTGLEILDLSLNDFSSAAVGLGSLSDWLQNSPVNLKNLSLEHCRISDEGLHALAEGAATHCEELDLDRNESITATGLRYLSSSIRSDSCRVETLYLQGTIRDDGMEALGQGLVGNQSLTSLHLVDYDNGITVTSAGWLAFTTALCDTSSVNSTYLSNHTIHSIEDEVDGETIPRDISLYLRLNGEHPRYVARCKILMKHPHLDMTPFLHLGLKYLPLTLAWFERAKPCTSLTIHDEELDERRLVLEESEDAFQSRELTAMYEFVRGIPMEVLKSRKELIVAAYDDNDEIARIDERYREALEQRDRKIEQLEKEIKRLRGL